MKRGTITADGGSTYFTSQYLLKGRYMFRINAPFDTKMLVSPENPIPGLSFVDLNPEPNVFNATLAVPRDGQYGFKITLNKPIYGGALEVIFVPKESNSNDGGNEGGQPPTEISGPTQPSPEWTFIYEAGKNNISLNIRGSKYILNYYDKSTNQTYFTWTCEREFGNTLKCSEAQNPGITQWIKHSDDWKSIWQGKLRFDLIRKNKR